MTDVTGLATLTADSVAYLKNLPSLLAAAQQGILGFDEDGLWVFQGNAEENYQPFRDPQGTGYSAIVVSSDDTWASGSDYSTAQFPMLQVLIYSDCQRGVDGKPVNKDQKVKAFHLYSLIDDVLNDLANELHVLFGTPILRIKRGYGPRIDPVPATAGLVRCTAKYEVLLAR